MNGEFSPLDELEVVRRRYVVRPTETSEHRSTLGKDLPNEEGGDKKEGGCRLRRVTDKGRWLSIDEGGR